MNLRIIEGAKDEWALMNRKEAGDRVSLVELRPYFKGGTVSLHADEKYFPRSLGHPAAARIPVPLGNYKAGSMIFAP